MMGYNDGWGAMGWLGGIMMLVVWVALIALVVLAARALFPGERRDERRSAPRESRDAALELLRRRYAAGEIDAAEYEQARRTLELGASQPWP